MHRFRRWLPGRSGTNHHLERLLGFFAVTTLLIWMMPSDFRLEHHIGGDVVFLFTQLIAYALVLFLAWRSVGGKAALSDHIPTYIYFSAIYILLIMVTVTTFMGALHAFDPTLYGNIVQAFHEGDYLRFVLSPAYSETWSKSPLIVAGIGIVGGSLIILWSLACWGAYRDLNHASRLRSTMAGFIFVILSVFTYGVLATLAEAFVAALTSA